MKAVAGSTALLGAPSGSGSGLAAAQSIAIIASVHDDGSSGLADLLAWDRDGG